MKKRVLSISLAFCMVLALLPIEALAAEDAPPPTNLRWDEKGNILFDVSEECIEVFFELYRDEQYIDGNGANWWLASDLKEDGYFCFPLSRQIDKSGSYTAKLKARYPTDSGNDYNYSDWSISAPFLYVHPGKSLQLPTNFAIGENFVPTWIKSSANIGNVGSYHITLYNIDTPRGRHLFASSHIPFELESVPTPFLLNKIQERYQANGYSGPYGFTIRAVSDDITLIGHSEESEMLIFSYDGSSTPVKSELPAPAEDKLSLNVSTLNLDVGQTSHVTASITGYEDKSVYAISSDTRVATVSVSGASISVTGTAEGTASVYVIMSDTKLVTLDAAKADPSMQEIKVIVTKVADNDDSGDDDDYAPPSFSSSGSSSSGGSSSGGSTSKPVTTITPDVPKPEIVKPASEVFTDVVAGSWYEDGVTFVANKGLFNGMTEEEFAPELNMTRAMLMTVLARLDGQDTAGGDPWYAKSMDWAKNAGISDGTMPESSVTREQLVTMLYRYAKATPGKGELSDFVDGNTVSPWAVDAMTWAVDEGIITGTDWGGLYPQGTATRAEVAVLFQRFVEKMGK